MKEPAAFRVGGLEAGASPAIGGSVHLYMALGGSALIALHVAAALKHQFVNRDGVLGRMVPGLSSTPAQL